MTCPKCGKMSTGPRWHKAAAAYAETCGLFDHAKNRAEHLHYYCVCGYDWTTETREQHLKRSAADA